MRAIAEVATAVTKGDLDAARLQVDARGEVAELKDNINTMIDNLRLTTDRNTEQDWLKTNLAKFTNMLQGQRDLSLGRPLAAVRTRAAGRCAPGRDLPASSPMRANRALRAARRLTPTAAMSGHRARAELRRGPGRPVRVPIAASC